MEFAQFDKHNAAKREKRAVCLWTERLKFEGKKKSISESHCRSFLGVLSPKTKGITKLDTNKNLVAYLFRGKASKNGRTLSAYVAQRNTVLHRVNNRFGISLGRGSSGASLSNSSQNLESSSVSANRGSAAMTSSMKDQSTGKPRLRNCNHNIKRKDTQRLKTSVTARQQGKPCIKKRKKARG